LRHASGQTNTERQTDKQTYRHTYGNTLHPYFPDMTYNVFSETLNPAQSLHPTVAQSKKYAPEQKQLNSYVINPN